MDDFDYIQKRYIDSREEVSTIFFRTLIEKACENSFLSSIFPDIFDTYEGIKIACGQKAIKSSENESIIQLEKHLPTDYKSGKTWDHLFRRDYRAADILLCKAEQINCIIENKIANAGFNLQQLLYYHLWFLEKILNKEEQKQFYLICLFLDSKRDSKKHLFKNENLDIFKRHGRTFSCKLSELAYTAEMMLKEFQEILHSHNKYVIHCKENNRDILFSNLQNFIEHYDEIKCDPILKNGKTLLMKINDVSIAWHFVSWSSIKWNIIAEKLNECKSVNSKICNQILANEAILFFNYYNH